MYGLKPVPSKLTHYPGRTLPERSISFKRAFVVSESGIFGGRR